MKSALAPVFVSMALFALFPAPVLATNQADVLSAELRPGWRTDQGSHMTALHLRLAPEWKTYWRAPGDSGIPPHFDWSGSENLAGVKIHWPVPSVFSLNDLQIIGYMDSLMLPIELIATDPNAPIILRAHVDLGVCRDICLPASLEFEADLPTGGEPDAAISTALAARPRTAKEAGLIAIRCTIDPISDGLRITAQIDIPSSGGVETTVFELADASVWISEATSQRDGGRLTATSEMVASSGAPFALDRSTVRVTILGSERAVEMTGCPGG